MFYQHNLDRNEPWTKHCALWCPEPAVQHSFQIEVYNQQLENDKAVAALQMLRDLKVVKYYRTSAGCVVHFISFPLSITDTIIGAYYDIFKYQNDEFNFIYLCLISCWINPVSKWQRQWMEKFMPNILLIHPERVWKLPKGVPDTVGEAIDYFHPGDYGETDWIIQSKVYQRKHGEPVQNWNQTTWCCLSNPEEYKKFGGYQAYHSKSEKISTKFEFSIGFFHEDFDIFQYLNGTLAAMWYYEKANCVTKDCLKYRTFEPNFIPTLDHWSPFHQGLYSYLHHRFDYYCTQMIAIQGIGKRKRQECFYHVEDAEVANQLSALRIQADAHSTPLPQDSPSDAESEEGIDFSTNEDFYDSLCEEERHNLLNRLEG